MWVFRLQVSPLRPRLIQVAPSPNRLRALQLKPRLKSDSWVPEMCSTETRPGPCPTRPSGAGNVSTRNRPWEPFSRKPSSQDQTLGHKRRSEETGKEEGNSQGVGESEVVMQLREFGWEFRDHTRDISLPRLLGRGRRRLDTGGGRGPSEKQSRNAGRSLLGELVWRLWFSQSRGPALPTKACFFLFFFYLSIHLFTHPPSHSSNMSSKKPSVWPSIHLSSHPTMYPFINPSIQSLFQ